MVLYATFAIVTGIVPPLHSNSGITHRFGGHPAQDSQKVLFVVPRPSWNLTMGVLRNRYIPFHMFISDSTRPTSWSEPEMMRICAGGQALVTSQGSVLQGTRIQPLG